MLPLSGLLSFQHLFQQAALQKAPYPVRAVQHQRGELSYVCHRHSYIHPSDLQGFLLRTRMSHLFLTFSYFCPEMKQGGLRVSLTLATPIFFPCPRKAQTYCLPLVLRLISICHKLVWLLKGTLCVDLNSLDPTPLQSRFLAYES